MTNELIDLKSRLAEAREAVDTCIFGAFEANSSYSTNKSDLESQVANARTEGRIEGKNEADREAHARMLFGQEYENVDSAAFMLGVARANLERAKNTLDGLRDELEIYKVAAALQRDFAAAA